MAVQAIPDGMHTITPHLVCQGAADAIEFYKKAFNAEEVGRFPTPDGRLMHAHIKVGDSSVFIADEFLEMGGGGSPKKLGGTAVTLALYVTDADKAWKQALDAGAKVVVPIEDMFWGDRYGILEDPFGHSWSISTHVKDVTEEEMRKAGAEAFAHQG